MEAIGRVINVVHVASGVPIPLTGASAVTFVGYEVGGATDVVFTELTAASGGSEQNFINRITRYFTSNGIGGAWTTRTKAAASHIVEPTDDAAQNGWAVTIHAGQLSDGFTHVECTPDDGTCVAILHDLTHQAAPDNLPAIA